MSGPRAFDPGPEGARTPAGSRGMFEVLFVAPEFRRIFFARYASLFGDWFNLLAVLSLLRELGVVDARGVGAVIILKLLPSALAGPLAGIVADRVSRKAIMIVTDLLRFGFVGTLFLAPLLGREWGAALVYAATALQITAQAFAEPARQAAIPNTVPPHLLGIANVLSSVTWSITFTVGAGIGGIVTSAFGWRVALALDAMTYLVSIAILLPLRLAPLGQAEGAPQGAVSWRDLTDAVRFVAGRRDAAIALLAKPLWGLAGALTLMLTLFGERVFPLFGSPDAGIAALYMARGIGTAIGPIAARRLYGESTRPMLRGIGLAFVVSGAGYALLSIAPNAPFAALVVLIAHLGGSTIWFFSTLILQRTVPDGMRGRVFAAELALATLAISASTWFYGAWIDGADVSLHVATRVLAGSLLAGAAVWCALALSPIARRAESPRSPAP